MCVRTYYVIFSVSNIRYVRTHDYVIVSKSRHSEKSICSHRSRPSSRSRPSPRCPRRRRVRRKTIADAFGFAMGRLFPGALSWFDYSQVVATRRGAVPREHRLRAEFIFRIERQLRLRLPVVRETFPMPATLERMGLCIGVVEAVLCRTGLRPRQS